MKKLLTLFAISLAVVLSSCSTFDDEAIWNKLDDHESRISRLEEMCREMNSNIDALQTIVTALQTNDYVTSVTPVTKDGETVGYTITFTKSDPITIYHGTDGKDGKDGKDGIDSYTPIIGVKQDADGIYYWTLDGEWLLDDAGNKIKAQGTDGKDGIDGTDGKDGINGTDGKDGINGTDGKDGADGTDGKDGADGITPLLKIENNYWYISYDNGVSWTQLGKATGEDGKDGADGKDGIDGANGSDGADGKDGDSFFEDVDTSNEDYVIFTLADGTTIKIPTWYAFEELKKQCEEMNQNITAMQQILEALQNNDYVTSVQQIVEDGKTIGYTIYFSKSGAVTIYHGEDGKDGADGTDGVNGADGKDGHSPIVGVRQDSDGIYYWTLDGEWLLDENGNKIKAQGTDGKDGQDGEDGKDGQDGADGTDGVDGENGADGKDGVDSITPQLKIENDYWYISYDNGSTWTQLGKATGEDGKDGADGKDGIDGANGADGMDGKDGDSFFQGVTQDEQFVYFTLADGTVITLPKGAALDITFAESDLVVMSPNSTREIGYTVTSATETVKVEVTSSADIKAKAVTDNASGLTGKIHIITGDAIDEYSKVIVFVSNGDKVIMRSITFEEAGLMVEENATLYAAAEGGEVALNFLTNVECSVAIPEEAQDWISVVPATRAMERQTITLKLEPNEGYYRSATVTVQSSDGALKLEYQVEQDGVLGVNIDPTQIPDNEIWYTTTDGQIISLNNAQTDWNYPETEFGAKVISNTYVNGKGVIKFDVELSQIGSWAFWRCENLHKMYLPSKIKSIGDNAFNNCVNLQILYLSNDISSAGSYIFDNCLNLQSFESVLASDDKKTLIVNSTIVGFAPYGITEYKTPIGVKNIGDGAFCNAYILKKIIISEGVENIGFEAFIAEDPNRDSFSSQYNLEATIEEVYLPSTLKTMHPYAFLFQNKIKGIYGNNEFVSADNKFIWQYDGCGRKVLCTFTSGANIREYSIPEGIQVVQNYVFYNSQIESVEFPSTLCQCPSGYVFELCHNLKSFSGKYATTDGKALCEDGTINVLACAGITEYTTPDEITAIGEGVFVNKDNLESITLSDNVKHLYGSNNFGYCDNLRTVTLSAGLLDLGSSTFYPAPKLEAVYCRAINPPGYNPPMSGEGVISNYFDFDFYVPNESLDRYKSSMKYLAFTNIKGYDFDNLPQIDYYYSTDYSADGDVTTLQTATKGNGIDIVLMGDAYSDRQIADGTYREDMENLYNNLFTEEPYKSFKDHFNVYYVNVVSATEGYEYGNTALDGYFGDGSLVGGNDNAAFNYALKAISDEEMDEALLIVAMNSDNYAGTCYMYYPETNADYGNGVSVAYFPRGGDAETFAQLLHHEACGHGFAKLADEYAYEYMGAVPSDYASEIQSQQANWGWWKNVDFTSDTSAIRWSNFINDARYANEGLGAFEGGLTYWNGVWRPTENSIMRHNTGGFNAPSREAIYYRIHKLAYGDSWEYDYEEFVEWDAINRTAAAAAKRKSTKPATYKPTHAPIIVNKSWRDAK